MGAPHLKVVDAPKYLFKEFTARSMSSIKLYSLFVTLMSQAKKKKSKSNDVHSKDQPSAVTIYVFDKRTQIREHKNVFTREQVV